ncbi:MAG: hypothetical protein ABEJ65_02415, partial [bacterium]
LIQLCQNDIQREEEIRRLLSDQQNTEQHQSSIRPRDHAKRVHNLLHSLDNMKPSEAYWHVSDVVEDVLDLVEEIQGRLGFGDDSRVLQALEEVVKTYISEWLVLDGSDGSTSRAYDHLSRALTEAYLSVDMSESDRARRAEQIEQWQEELEPYGVGRRLEPARTAALFGEDHRALKKAASSTDDSPELDMDSFHERTLAEAYRAILQRRGENKKILRLSLATRDPEWIAEAYVELNKPEKGLDWIRNNLEDPRKARSVFETLWSSGGGDDVLDTAREFVMNSGEKVWSGSLTEWVRDRALEENREKIAREMARYSCITRPSLSNYDMCRKISGEQWPDDRQRILESLRGQVHSSTQGAVDIFLEENEYGQALNQLEATRDFDLIRRVCEESVEACPKRVRDIAREQAEDIMDNGRSQAYHHARDWLRIVKQAHKELGEIDEWNNYHSNLLDKHSRKYKLVPKLEELGSIRV